MKKYLLIFLITICTMFMLGCSIEIMSIGNSTKDSWSKEYKMFRGSESKRIKVEKDQVVKFDVVSEKGNLDIEIEDENGNTCFSKDNIETSTFEFIPESDGKYKIKFNAKNHQGSFDVLWEK